MQTTRAPIILPGQVYYSEESNAYLVVTKKVGEMVRYKYQRYGAFTGVTGNMEDIDFIERFQPVDPQDLTQDEEAELLELCGSGATLKVGFVKEN